LSARLRCSTKALEVAGLLVDGASLASLCPRDGKIVTDASNRPVGLLYDAAQDLILRAIPPLTQEVGEDRAFEDSWVPPYLHHQYNTHSPIRTSNPRSDRVYRCQVRVAALKLALDRMMSLGITGYLEALVKNDRYGTLSQPIIKTSSPCPLIPCIYLITGNWQCTSSSMPTKTWRHDCLGADWPCSAGPYRTFKHYRYDCRRLKKCPSKWEPSNIRRVWLLGLLFYSKRRHGRVSVFIWAWRSSW
jgi:hypothetical protein